MPRRPKSSSSSTDFSSSPTNARLSFSTGACAPRLRWKRICSWNDVWYEKTAVNPDHDNLPSRCLWYAVSVLLRNNSLIIRSPERAVRAWWVTNHLILQVPKQKQHSGVLCACVTLSSSVQTISVLAISNSNRRLVIQSDKANVYTDVLSLAETTRDSLFRECDYAPESLNL